MKPRVVFILKSYRLIEAGGTDSAGKYRGFNIEKRSKSDWKMLRFLTDQREAEELIRKQVLDGKPLISRGLRTNTRPPTMYR